MITLVYALKVIGLLVLLCSAAIVIMAGVHLAIYMASDEDAREGDESL